MRNTQREVKGGLKKFKNYRELIGPSDEYFRVHFDVGWSDTSRLSRRRQLVS